MQKHKTINYLAFFSLAFFGVYVGAFQRFLEEISSDFSITKVVMGLIVTIHFVGFFLGNLFVGELSDRYGRKVIIVSSFISFLTGLFFILGAVNPLMLMTGVFFGGVGFGTAESSLTTLLTDADPLESNRTINISQVFFGIGATIGPFAAMAFIVLLPQWRYFYPICIIICLVLLIIFWKYPFPDYKPSEEVDGIIAFKLVKQKIFILLFISIVMYVGIEEGVAFWITTYVKEWNMKEYLPSLILSVFWGSMVLGRYYLSRFSKKLNEIIIISSTLFLFFLIMALISVNPVIVFISFFGIGLCISGIWPILIAQSRIYFPEYSGTAISIMMSGGAVGGFVIPLIMGYLGSALSMKYGLAFCMLPGVIIIINNFAVMKIKKNNHDLTKVKGNGYFENS